MNFFTKSCLAILVLCSFLSGALHAQVGVGTTSPNASAMLDVTSTSKGFLPPRMTSQQRDSISAPAAGLIVYCSNCGNSGELDFFNGGAWVSATGDVAASGPSIYSLSIGDSYLGGVVAYIFTPVDQQYVAGQVHGIVTTVCDVGTTVAFVNGGTVTNISADSIIHPWAPSGTFIATGAGDTATGLGANNTTKIVLAEGVGNYAAYICEHYTAYYTGAAGWYLPDRNEIEKLYASATIIGGFIGQQQVAAKQWKLKSGGQLGKYWTSTTDILAYPPYTEMNNAQSYDLGGGYLTGSTRTSTFYIRPVKRF